VCVCRHLGIAGRGVSENVLDLHQRVSPVITPITVNPGIRLTRPRQHALVGNLERSLRVLHRADVEPLEGPIWATVGVSRQRHGFAPEEELGLVYAYMCVCVCVGACICGNVCVSACQSLYGVCIHACMYVTHTHTHTHTQAISS
jgi:hypothetical protein